MIGGSLRDQRIANGEIAPFRQTQAIYLSAAGLNRRPLKTHFESIFPMKLG
jgi:hypothetical protein